MKYKFSHKIFSYRRALTQYKFRKFQPITNAISIFTRSLTAGVEKCFGEEKTAFRERRPLSLSLSSPPSLSSRPERNLRGERERGKEGEEDMRKRSNHPRSVSNNRVAVLFILAFFLSVAGTVSVIRGPIFTHAFCFRARWMSDNEAWGL